MVPEGGAGAFTACGAAGGAAGAPGEHQHWQQQPRHEAGQSEATASLDDVQLHLQPSQDAVRTGSAGDACGAQARATTESLAATFGRFKQSVAEMQHMLLQLQKLPPHEVQQLSQQLSPGAVAQPAAAATPSPAKHGAAHSCDVSAQVLVEVTQMLHGLEAVLATKAGGTTGHRAAVGG